MESSPPLKPGHGGRSGQREYTGTTTPAVGARDARVRPVRALRLRSYLAPSIPAELFELLARWIEAATAIPVLLEFETRISGPTPDADPFAEDRADVAFVCAPSYPLLRQAGSPVVLLPLAPVFADSRARDRPVYFSDVIVRSEHPARRFDELRGTVWAYNDRQSRSGWQNMLARLAQIHAGGPDSFFRDLLHAGSHLASIEQVVSGHADAASIDSNTLWLARRRNPELERRLRLIESWGPTPIQPLLARAGLPSGIRDRVADALRSATVDPAMRERLAEFGLRRFAPIAEADYASAGPIAVLPPSSISILI
jgi:phosphonate transport system substrate-binding protein